MNTEDSGNTSPKKTSEDFVVWTMSSRDETPRPVTTMDVTKPCVFFFGGGAHLCKGDQSVPSQLKAMNEILAPTTADSDYNFYTLTNKTTDDKTASLYAAGVKNQAYNDDPRAFSSEEAKSFVASYLMPLVKDVQKLPPEKRSAAVSSTAKNFSAVTFFGYSYGTAFIQEISNALNVALDGKGYSDKEIGSVMKSLAAVNIGATFKYIPKYLDIPQTTLILANDVEAVKNSGLSPASVYLDFTHIGSKLAYAQNGSHTIIYADNASTRLRNLTYHSPASNDSFTSLIAQAKNWTDTLPAEDTPTVLNKVVHAHNKGLQTASMRWHLDPEATSYTFPSNLVGVNSVRFLQDAVKGSADALRKNVIRDTTALTERCITKNLSPEAVQSDITQTNFFQQLFEKLSGQTASLSK